MDAGRKYADEILEQIEEQIGRDITSEYAEKEIKKYLNRHSAEIEKMQQAVNDGDITKQEYYQWIDRVLLRGKDWNKVRDDIAKDYSRQMAEALVAAGALIGMVYINSRNYTSYAIEKAVKKNGLNISIERIKNIPKPIMPKSPDPSKNRFWHRQHLQATIRHGMRKGESIDKIAKRVHRITGMDRVAATRTARTTVTSAESKAALDSMYDARSKGIYMQKRWYAVKDERTRTSHRILDGETVDLDKPFSNGLMRPGEPADGVDGSEIYNCRCRLLSVANGIDVGSISESPNNMGRLEWIAKKPKSKPMKKKWGE